MKARQGSFSVLCVLLLMSLLMLSLSIKQVLVAEYKNLQVDIRQQQLFYIANSLADSSLSFLEARMPFTQKFLLTVVEEQEQIAAEVAVITNNNVAWLSSKAEIGQLRLNIIKCIAQPPDQQSDFYKFNVVGKQVVLSEGVSVDKKLVAEYSQVSQLSNGGLAKIRTGFINYNIKDYEKFAFLWPTSETLELGLAKSLFFDVQGGIYYFPAKKKIVGAGLFVRHGDVFIGEYSYFPDLLIIITQGNIVIDKGVELEQALLIAGGNIEIRQGAKICGKIFAQNRINIASQVVIRDIEGQRLTFYTNKYLW